MPYRLYRRYKKANDPECNWNVQKMLLYDTLDGALETMSAEIAYEKEQNSNSQEYYMHVDGTIETYVQLLDADGRERTAFLTIFIHFEHLERNENDNNMIWERGLRGGIGRTQERIHD